MNGLNNRTQYQTSTSPESRKGSACVRSSGEARTQSAATMIVGTSPAVRMLAVRRRRSR